MLHIVLYEPEIPPNTGNIMRLCANTGVSLHLIEPLGFDLDEKKLRRAGMDYRDLANVTTHPNLQHFIETQSPNTLYACSTKGKFVYSKAIFKKNDALLFGPETRGLPSSVLDLFSEEQIIRIPMMPESRSINLSNAVSIILYEAWQQLGFKGGN